VRSLSLILCCAALVLVAGAGAAAARRAAPPCGPRGAHTIARSGGTRLYVVGGGGAGEYSAPSTLFVCQRAHRRPKRLVHAPDSYSMGIVHVRFSGTYVAFDVTVSNEPCSKYDFGPQCISESVRSYNVRNGRLRASAGGGSDALALASNGWIAWVPPAASGAARTLLAVDSAGRRQLDSGTIDPASLRATRNTVHWTNGGAAQSAALH
jgi:hypothetical protein